MADREKNSRRKAAVALEYNPQDAAPKIVATGHGMIAERIVQAAQEAAVPVHEDARLAGTLSKLEVGELIPPELYNVVAEVLVYVDRMDHIKNKIGKGHKPL